MIKTTTPPSPLMPLLSFLIILALFCVPVGCGSGKRSVEDGVTRIEVWHGFTSEETDLFHSLMQDFEAEWEKKHNEKLEIDIRFVSFGDMFTKLRTAALANSTPDIAFMDTAKVVDLAFGQALLPIDQLEGFKTRYGTIDGGRSEFVAASYDAAVINRLGEVHLYGVPVQTTTVALFWNKEMFRREAQKLLAAGLDPNRAPKDWDELARYAEVLSNQEEGRYGFGTHSSMWFNFPIFNMYGMEFVEYTESGEAKAAFNTPNGRAALQRLQNIALSDWEGGAWQPNGTGPDDGFINQRYAMIISGPWQVPNFTNSGIDFDIALIPAPTEAEIKELGLQPVDPTLVEEIGSAGYTASNLGGQTGVILRKSQNPEAAYEVLEFFTSETIQRQWCSTLGQIPVRKAAWKDLDMSKFPYMRTFMQQIRTSKRIPQIPYYGILESDLFNPQIDLLMRDKLEPEQMLDRMESGFKDRILKKINVKSKS
ncbi:MAG: extracellular solute-binding protein [Candidatus Sumerlaeia bacterium]|nr:extracellular solute-binding protein [Candidatus Sumerlaeia bacterium]